MKVGELVELLNTSENYAAFLINLTLYGESIDNVKTYLINSAIEYACRSNDCFNSGQYVDYSDNAYTILSELITECTDLDKIVLNVKFIETIVNMLAKVNPQYVKVKGIKNLTVIFKSIHRRFPELFASIHDKWQNNMLQIVLSIFKLDIYEDYISCFRTKHDIYDGSDQDYVSYVLNNTFKPLLNFLYNDANVSPIHKNKFGKCFNDTVLISEVTDAKKKTNKSSK